MGLAALSVIPAANGRTPMTNRGPRPRHGSNWWIPEAVSCGRSTQRVHSPFVASWGVAQLGSALR